MRLFVMMMGRTVSTQGKFYNMQDLGLSKALAGLEHKVSLYNFVEGTEDTSCVINENLDVYYLHAKAIGTHTFHDFDFITPDIDAVICYSDNQLNYKKVWKKCNKNNVVLIPYIGVLGSHNRNPIITKLLDVLIPNNRYYKQQRVFAKTPEVKRQMLESGILDVVVAPACLDIESVKQDYQDISKTEIKQELGFKQQEKVLLFIGRMIEEKWPLEIIDIFENIHKQSPDTKLVMIGKGQLLEQVQDKINNGNCKEKITLIPQINNSEIWKYYYAADVFINLNRVEIFGMAILESMYYGCPVVARKAPGPEYILRDGETGYLCDNTAEVEERVFEILNQDMSTLIGRAKQRILNDFMWESTAKIVEKSVLECMGKEKD